jgi:carbohydrate-selective porin OprB
MKHGLKNVAAGCAAVALLIGASAGAANASYLGYGNGDPGNWGFWDEQHGGPAHKAKAQSHAHHMAMHHHYLSKEQHS